MAAMAYVVQVNGEADRHSYWTRWRPRLVRAAASYLVAAGIGAVGCIIVAAALAYPDRVWITATGIIPLLVTGLAGWQARRVRRASEQKGTPFDHYTGRIENAHF